MKKERIIEEMAKLDNGENPSLLAINAQEGLALTSQMYPVDLNAVRRVLLGMDDAVTEKYRDELIDLLIADDEIIRSTDIEIFSRGCLLIAKATAYEQCEAILKAHGTWEE